LKIVITGRPGSGKSTVLRKVIEKLKSLGLTVGGIVCPDVRDSQGKRIGFKIINVLTGEEGWLAKAYEQGYPRIGKYKVHVEEAERIGVKALDEALEKADIIVIDEIGPMELLISKLRMKFIEVLKSTKPTIVIAHYRLNDREILKLLSGSLKFEVNLANRDNLPTVITDKITTMLKGSLRI